MSKINALVDVSPFHCCSTTDISNGLLSTDKVSTFLENLTNNFAINNAFKINILPKCALLHLNTNSSGTIIPPANQIMPRGLLVFKTNRQFPNESIAQIHSFKKDISTHLFPIPIQMIN
eukprot:NODE_131_length_16689_cov_0.437914.p16 type:complete len:119 gc:universal NODE_131_length_16689_cov_0.437914:6575-6931(+)